MRLLIETAISETEKIDNLIIVCYIKFTIKLKFLKKSSHLKQLRYIN